MYAVGRLGSYITRGVYTVSGTFHPFGGAVDIIVVEQPDGSFKSSPWYVRFGKFQGVLKAREKEVTINVNGIEASFHMFLDQRGEAYFLREIGGAGESVSYASYSSDEMDDQVQESRRPVKSKSCNYDSIELDSVIPFDDSNGKIVALTDSSQSRISRFVFGQRSMKEDSYLKGDDDAGMVRISSLHCAEIADDLAETFILDKNDLKKELVEISEITRNIDESSLRDAEQDGSAEDLIPEVTSSDSKIADTVVAPPGKKFDEQQPSDGENAEFSGVDISEEGNGSGRVQSFICCETSESSIMGLKGLKEQSEETLYIAPGGSRGVQFCTETLQITADQLAEDTGNHQAEDISPHQTCPSSSVHGHDKANLPLPLPVTTSLTHVVSVDPAVGLVENKSKDIDSFSGYSNSVHQIQDKVYVGKKIESNELQLSPESVGDLEQLNGDCSPTRASSIPVMESSEEEQFFFSDVDEFEIREDQGELSFPDAVNEDNLVPMNGLNNFENSTENAKVISSPICIHMNTDSGADVARLAESLPNLWSDIDTVGTEDLHPLSHSLDLDSKSLEWKLQVKNETQYTTTDTANGDQSAKRYSNEEDTEMLEDNKDGIDNHDVGMGAEDASHAFNDEKLDVDKFSLGPQILKNDRLVVRIGGCYFPWDAAAPIVLGMVTFGSENIFEPKGTIPVDKVEQSFVGSPSKAIVTTAGSWRLWPFPFRRSRSRKIMQPVLNDTRISVGENVSDSNIGIDNDKNEGKIMKNMVNAITPTSEELASLNLKEGSNEVTFTFSTAMLGRQKVDARIFLWKWNTCIVISDVDGTITKSDVLGQFMPLVGIDWSQNGVAHLFSAIKDNGYQFLYLSARAIAQAYITRQFLVNLKQDGKALPDGPVVISPDGLFPSLFREVIRRAPHEFKIACLEDIRALFPADCNPFYAGFGNRDTDEISYLKVGIPKGKIFIINPKGEVAVNRQVDTRSYTSLHALVHGMFPAMRSFEQEDFNSWNYWKLPPPDIDV